MPKPWTDRALVGRAAADCHRVGVTVRARASTSGRSDCDGTDDGRGDSVRLVAAPATCEPRRMPSSDPAGWHQTACILCECNCGIEVRLGGARRSAVRAHPRATRPTRPRRATRARRRCGSTTTRTGGTGSRTPLRRRADGTFEEIDWDTAIREVADRFAEVRDTHGGESIFYYGGGGQGNHLGGAYSGATMRALGARYRSNALAQEKTGEFWVNARMLGANVRGDFEHAEVGAVRRQEPVAVARHPARSDHAEGDRPRSDPRR